MKTVTAFAILLALCSAATANLAPMGRDITASVVANDSVMYPGSIGAMRESNYFRAPQPQSASNRIFPCQLRLYFSKQPMTFAPSCQ
jgi:hypothetical protein